MLGAARTGAWAKSGGIVNPYADDAMLFMFDGIWNDGIGKHVDTMQGEYIKNCVDGIGDMPVSNTNSKPFPWLDLESDCFYHNANIFANRKGPLEIQVPANEMTIELIIDISNPASGAFAYIPIPSAMYLFGYNGNQTYVPGGSFNHDALPFSEKHSYVLTHKRGEQKIFIDGQVFATSNKSLSSDVTSTKFCLPGSYNSGYGVTGGRYYAIRFSNRCMSESEVIKRCAIDKARFNLP